MRWDRPGQCLQSSSARPVVRMHDCQRTCSPSAVKHCPGYIAALIASHVSPLGITAQCPPLLSLPVPAGTTRRCTSWMMPAVGPSTSCCSASCDTCRSGQSTGPGRQQRQQPGRQPSRLRCRGQRQSRGQPNNPARMQSPLLLRQLLRRCIGNRMISRGTASRTAARLQAAVAVGPAAVPTLVRQPVVPPRQRCGRATGFSWSPCLQPCLGRAPWPAGWQLSILAAATGPKNFGDTWWAAPRGMFCLGEAEIWKRFAL